MSLKLLVWVDGGLLKRVLHFFGNEPSLGQKSPILHLLKNACRAYCTGYVLIKDLRRCHYNHFLRSHPTRESGVKTRNNVFSTVSLETSLSADVCMVMTLTSTVPSVSYLQGTILGLPPSPWNLVLYETIAQKRLSNLM